MRVGTLITARLKSSRLPKKVILPIHKRPMIAHMLDRLKLSEQSDMIIICTSALKQDDPLQKIASEENVEYYRGEPEDVLLRLTRAARQFDLDTVISCTADNPFVDPIYIDRLVDFHIKHDHDYSRSNGLPFGTFSYALSLRAMEKACEIKAVSDTEVWGGYFTETGIFSVGVMEVVDPDVRWPDLRLTVDTPEDFELISRIFGELHSPGKTFPLKEIVRLCRTRPDLVAINAHIQQEPGIPIKTRTKKNNG